jgi:hypothetical protein
VTGALLLLPEESPDELRRLKEDGLVFVVVDPLHDLGPGTSPRRR